jgi:hypothetical protein
MQKIVPFKKEIKFKTNLSEIVSIALEHSLHIEKNNINGEFIINGEYKISDNSINTDEFSFNLPFNIDIDEKYNIQNSVVDIEDFYYEIINNNILDIEINVLIDKMEEILIKPEKVIDSELIEVREDTNQEEEKIIDNRKKNTLVLNDDIDLDDISEIELKNEEESISKLEVVKEKNINETESTDLNFLISDTNEKEIYSTYHVCIVRENDTIESIMAKYNVDTDLLSKYNNISEIKIGDKIIIPYAKSQKL